MSSLALPTHVARQIAFERRSQERPPEPPPQFAEIIKALEQAEGHETVQDIDTPIPDGLPPATHWRITLMPVRQLARSGSIILTAEALDVQRWTHQLWKVCSVGPLACKGPAWHGFTPEDLEGAKPRVGDLYLCDPKAPRRYKYKKITFIVVNDDQLWSKVDPDKIDGLEFSNGAL